MPLKIERRLERWLRRKHLSSSKDMGLHHRNTCKARCGMCNPMCYGMMGVSWLDRQLGMHMERPHLKQDGGQGLTPGAVLWLDTCLHMCAHTQDTLLCL